MAYTIDLSGRVALVTGGGRGIGAEICRTLAEAGAAVAVNYCHSPDKAAAVVAEIEAAGGRARAFHADVGDRDAVASMGEEIAASLGGVDILVNNAISSPPWKPFLEQEWAAYESQWRTQLGAACNTDWAFVPGMKDRGWGRIICISTVCFIENGPNQSAYNASKGALYGWCRTVARELGPANITVNQIAPGWMVTEKVDPNSAGSRAYAERVPLRRHGHAREIANAALYFASELAGFVTGAYLPVCGGLFLY